MKFCILMPAYNAANDIEKAIKSVLNQTYSDFRLIVVNDGSTDDTLTVLNRFANEERIKILTQENTGIAGAYELAFKYLDGDYIMFLDSDDALAPNALEEICETVTHKNPDIVQFGISYFDESWKHKKDLVFAQREINEHHQILLNYFNGINDGSDRPNLGIRAYRKEMLADFVFPPIGSLGIDEILNLYAMTKCQKIAFVPKAYYLCQQRTSSVSRIKPTVKKVGGVLRSYDEMERIILENHAEFQDLLYAKFIKFYVGHLSLIRELSTYQEQKKKFRYQVSIVKKSTRVRFSKKMRIGIFMLSHFPFLASWISQK